MAKRVQKKRRWGWIRYLYDERPLMVRSRFFFPFWFHTRYMQIIFFCLFLLVRDIFKCICSALSRDIFFILWLYLYFFLQCYPSLSEPYSQTTSTLLPAIWLLLQLQLLLLLLRSKLYRLQITLLVPHFQHMVCFTFFCFFIFTRLLSFSFVFILEIIHGRRIRNIAFSDCSWIKVFMDISFFVVYLHWIEKFHIWI